MHLFGEHDNPHRTLMVQLVRVQFGGRHKSRLWTKHERIYESAVNEGSRFTPGDRTSGIVKARHRVRSGKNTACIEALNRRKGKNRQTQRGHHADGRGTPVV